MRWRRFTGRDDARVVDAERVDPALAKGPEARTRQYVRTWSGLLLRADSPAVQQSWNFSRGGFPKGGGHLLSVPISEGVNTEVAWVMGCVLAHNINPDATLVQGYYNKAPTPSHGGWSTELRMMHEPLTTENADAGELVTEIPYGAPLEVRIPVPRGMHLFVTHRQDGMLLAISVPPNGLPVASGHVAVGLRVDP